MLDFIFSESNLFASGLPWDVLSQFKRWPINAVTGSQRCRQHEPSMKAESSVLELFREDVRCVGPEVWPEEFSHLRLRRSVKYCVIPIWYSFRKIIATH